MAYVPSCDVLFQTELPKTGCVERAVDRYFEEQNASSFLTESKTTGCLKRGPSTQKQKHEEKKYGKRSGFLEAKKAFEVRIELPAQH